MCALDAAVSNQLHCCQRQSEVFEWCRTYFVLTVWSRFSLWKACWHKTEELASKTQLPLLSRMSIASRRLSHSLQPPLERRMTPQREAARWPESTSLRPWWEFFSRDDLFCVSTTLSMSGLHSLQVFVCLEGDAKLEVGHWKTFLTIKWCLLTIESLKYFLFFIPL